MCRKMIQVPQTKEKFMHPDTSSSILGKEPLMSAIKSAKSNNDAI